ncbi:unnamed protein product [Mytilus edulis]|uniref:C1q domain-containing protein n=1 Tax=Mytilus edulis TaxID=6550 RepID=A0A8S3PLN3_MYTED|nr:unnamed protein product [Mytilus edulis]
MYTDASIFLFLLCCCSFAYGDSAAEQTINTNIFGKNRPINERDINYKDHQELLLMLSDINRFAKLLEHQLNLTMTRVNNIEHILSKRISDFNNSSGKKDMISHSEQKHTAINRKVALTACTEGGELYRNGSLIDFTDIRQLYGMKNIDDFKKTRKFTCLSSGLYLLSVYINSFSHGSQYRLLKNNMELGRVQIAPDRDLGTSSWHTGSGFAAAMLNVNDTMSIQAWSSVYIAGSYSCITIVKL